MASPGRAFGRLADYCQRLLTKGSPAYIEGRFCAPERLPSAEYGVFQRLGRRKT
jgi:hypothetical protein